MKSYVKFFSLIAISLISTNALAQACRDGIDNDGDGMTDALIFSPAGNGGAVTVGNGDPYFLKDLYVGEANRRGFGGLSTRDVMLYDQATANIYCHWIGYQYADSLICNSPNYGRCGFRNPGDNILHRWNGFGFSQDPANNNNTWLVSFRCVNKIAACKDGLDNDGDGRVDSQDSGCVNGDDNSELVHDSACGTDPNRNSELEECSDGVDNDRNGVADRNDPACWAQAGNPNSYDPKKGPEAGGILARVGATNLSASDGSSAEFILIRWSAAQAPVSGYRVYRSDAASTLGNVVATVTAAEYRDTQAVPGAVYFYSVEPIGGVFVPSFSNTDSGFRPEAVGARLKSPIYSKFNTFLNQANFLELIDEGTKDTSVTITVYNLRGQVMISESVALKAKSQFDIDINGLVKRACDFTNPASCSGFVDLDKSQLVDTYGLVRLDFDDKDIEKSIVGRISNYRLENDGRTYSFGFAKELKNSLTGRTYSTANTFDPQGSGFLVPNWAEIINLDSVTRNFSFVLYNQSGAPVMTQNFSLPPLGEFDISAGHELRNAQGKIEEGAYLGEVFSDGNYMFTISRYSSNSSAATAASYNYAFAVDARMGASENIFVPIANESREADCAIPSNWVEVVNTRSDFATGEITFRNASDNVVSQQISLPPKGQFHFNAGALLAKGTLGSAEIRSNQPGAFIAQSMTYYNDCAQNGVQTAFSLPGKVKGRKSQAGSVNTFLGMSNNLRLISTTTAASTASLSLTPVGDVTRNANISLGGNDTSDLSAANNSLFNINSDTYGILKVATPADGQAVGFVIRSRTTFDSGRRRLDFIMPTELR